ncbi:MAG: Asp-tRNA(Asn)/Glu-tRNA(Gln) amidotransferase subunit GatC [Methanosarcinales archaeon Met12]|nr:MAG: Asp-tRNA(Asn)/Glu-tRNA(Gln) amidotransferase subunit GatC [Methanosarcinales archaeon Met12]
MITKRDVEHIGWLARIKLTEEEKSKFTEQFNSILDYFERLDEVDPDVPPAHNISGLVNVFRADVVRGSMSRDDALDNAPKKEGEFFKGPRVV